MITPDKIRAARLAAGLSQKSAAALIGKSTRAWENWEAPIESGSHRQMDAALFELFMLKVHNQVSQLGT